MKTRARTKRSRPGALRPWSLGYWMVGFSILAGGATVRAEEAEAEAEEVKPALTPEQMFEGGEETFGNWIEFLYGGFITSGNQAQAEQRHRLADGAFGGIADFHYQTQVAKKTLMTLDGRALFDNEDYSITLDVRREDLGFVRFHYENFRTWYNGAGGFYPPAGMQYQLGDDALELDRGEVSFEAGLTLENVPKVTFRYAHRYRDGEKSSTIWGPSHPLGTTLVRGIVPGFYDIDEQVDTFELDALHTIKKTDIGLGLRYETADLNNARKNTYWPDEPTERKVTEQQKTSYDLFSAHAFTETWLKENLFFSTGFLFTSMDGDFSGSRIYGNDFDVSYAPNALNGLGYYDLSGAMDKKEYVLNLNLMATPWKHVTIVPSIRVMKEDWNSDSMGIGTSGNASSPFSAESDGDLLDVRERLDVRYTGITNWVVSVSGEWTQGDGDLSELGGLSQVSGVGVPPIQRQTEDERFFQKYSANARWYAARGVTLDFGGYYKRNEYEYDHTQDSTLNSSGNRYPAYLTMQDFETYDGNIRLTLRPHRKVSLVSRYEYQRSTVNTTPDSLSGLGEVESSQLTSHIIAQNVSYTPWTRLYLQAGFNYVISETESPASKITEAILNAENNYWTLNFNTGLVLDDKTDLNVGYFYYQTDNYSDNSADGLPLGLSDQEHGVTATLTRRISPRLRVMLRYGFYHYTDDTYGGNNDYQAHVVYSGLQYRF